MHAFASPTPATNPAAPRRLPTPCRKPSPAHRPPPAAFLHTPRRPPLQDTAHLITVYQFNELLRPLAHRSNSLPPCKLLFEQLLSRGLTPDKYTFSLMLVACASSNSAEYAARLCELLKTHGVSLDNHLRANLLTLSANASPPRIDQCIRIFRACKAPSSVMCNIMLDAFARVGRIDDCLETYRSMVLRGIQPDKYTVSAVVRAYVTVGRLRDGMKAVSQMYCAGLPITSPAFGLLIAAFGKRALLKDAVHVFDQMTILGVPPTQVTYNILISACAAADDVERAFDVYHQMRYTSPFMGDRYTYHSLMKCCLNTYQSPRALSVYAQIQATPFQCNQVSYRYAYQAAGQGLDIDALHTIYNDMENSALEPRPDTAGMLIAAAIRCSDLEAALLFFDRYANDNLFPHIFAALRAMEHSPEGVDFLGTSQVVHELQRTWNRSHK